jgi:cytochrome b561
MTSRVTLLLCLDTAMLLLVCVLECLALTGLDVHVWLGFALCPLVLVHVVMQWQWFVAQFQRIRTTRAYRVRINTLLNLGLLFMMSAVLLSGILSSGQATSVIGESFGRARVWRDIHGWLNFIVVVLVGLHLALNWDWMLAALRRRRPERPGLAGAKSKNAAAPSARWRLQFANSLGRGLAVLLVASLAAGAVYFAMWATMLPEEREPTHNERAATATEPPPKPPVPQPRPVELPHGVEQILVTSSVLVLTMLIGRFVFRLRL